MTCGNSNRWGCRQQPRLPSGVCRWSSLSKELSRYVDGLITWARKAHEASDPAEKLAAKRQVCSRWLNCVISESVASVWAVPWPVLPGEE